MIQSDVERALSLLRANPEYVDDARVGAPIGNSVAGSVLSLTYGTPRQYAERAVVEAVAILSAGGYASD